MTEYFSPALPTQQARAQRENGMRPGPGTEGGRTAPTISPPAPPPIEFTPEPMREGERGRQAGRRQRGKGGMRMRKGVRRTKYEARMRSRLLLHGGSSTSTSYSCCNGRGNRQSSQSILIVADNSQ